MLFLHAGTVKELAALERACAPAAFRRFVSGLKKAGLPPGLTILLHGAPGTGKTVAALNLAHAASRPVLQVDMSQLRDKYVGESEKNVRIVFNRWRECRDNGKDPAPLLLLNEADAMVGRRVAVGHSIDQMHNIMQNVLLEEMEHFDGILVATTNLIDNIDSAFDRRFLYKLRFDLPGMEERQHIWQSRMPKLKKEYAARLAAYPLSGAQIENVARRALLDGLLKKRIELAELEAMAIAEGSFRKGKVCVMGFAPKNAKEQNEEK
jgi:SpoVK/Ycf46/Vps4 family AAA+-type ATPase